MKRRTIVIEESLHRELRLVARRRGRSMAAVVRNAITREVAIDAGPTLSFIGGGDSGRRDIAERHEESLWRGPEPRLLEAAGKPSGAGPRSRPGRRAGKTRR